MLSAIPTRIYFYSIDIVGEVSVSLFAKLNSDQNSQPPAEHNILFNKENSFEMGLNVNRIILRHAVQKNDLNNWF